MLLKQANGIMCCTITSRRKLPRSPYKLETVSRACALLRELNDEGRALTLSEIVERTGMERTICFRLLRTLEDEGFLRRAERRKYASNLRIVTGKRFRIGYAAQGHDSFCAAVGHGLRRAAHEHEVDLIELDNQYNQRIALRNAEVLIQQKVDLAIEFQVYERIAVKLSDLFNEARIPVIALEIPQPGAAFFGVDNHQVGLLAGKALLRAAQKEWDGQWDELLLLDLDIAGSLPHMRISSAQSVLRKSVPGAWLTTHLESRGAFIRAFELTRKHLQFVPKRRTLLTGINDFAVLGALRAFEEAGRSRLCLAVGLGAIPEARRELRVSNTRLFGSVAFFPERYGEMVLELALDILHHRVTPPAIYAPVQLLTPKNVDQFYPKDIFGQSDIDLALVK
ncbi:MAG: substrate-binding domain-containing protein [Terriglobia bacterium]|nr:substrate-binding domain-containing protein [Terriglobia bacterium]